MIKRIYYQTSTKKIDYVVDQYMHNHTNPTDNKMVIREVFNNIKELEEKLEEYHRKGVITKFEIIDGPWQKAEKIKHWQYPRRRIVAIATR